MSDETFSLYDLGCLSLGLAVYKKRIETAKKYIEEAFEVSQCPYLSLSGGKDSVAMLAIVNDVATQLNRDFVIWAHISDASYPGTKETLVECATKSQRELILDESPVSAFSIKRDNPKQFGKKGIFFEAIADFQRSRSVDLAFIGVRAKESKRRTKAAKIHGHLFKSQVTGIEQLCCYPLIWFEVADVCAAIVQYGYPFHPIYSIAPDIDPTKIRLGYVTAQDLMHRGTISFLKRYYPETYNKLIQYFPERSSYA